MKAHAILSALLMPPLPLLLGLLLALVLRLCPSGSFFAKLSFPLAILSFAALWIAATPAFSSWLGGHLGEAVAPPGTVPRAVVVLGGGRYQNGISGSERLSAASLERVAWAAARAPEQLPILTSGGRVYEWEQLPEADMMADWLQKVFQRPVTWRETCSRSTAENAVNSAAVLRDSGVETVLLVTHWWHMPRAAEVFARAGLQVQPLPVGAAAEGLSRERDGLLRWLPSASALLRTQLYWREILARHWYRWRPLPPTRSC